VPATHIDAVVVITFGESSSTNIHEKLDRSHDKRKKALELELSGVQTEARLV
jgi:hypothetical protein